MGSTWVCHQAKLPLKKRQLLCRNENVTIDAADPAALTPPVTPPSYPSSPSPPSPPLPSPSPPVTEVCGKHLWADVEAAVAPSSNSSPTRSTSPKLRRSTTLLRTKTPPAVTNTAHRSPQGFKINSKSSLPFTSRPTQAFVYDLDISPPSTGRSAQGIANILKPSSASTSKQPHAETSNLKSSHPSGLRPQIFVNSLKSAPSSALRSPQVLIGNLNLPPASCIVSENLSIVKKRKSTALNVDSRTSAGSECGQDWSRFQKKLPGSGLLDRPAVEYGSGSYYDRSRDSLIGVQRLLPL